MFFRLSLLGFELFTLSVGRTEEEGFVHVALPAGYELAEEEEQESIAFGFAGR